MFKNYFKTALRNLSRHNLFSGLIIFGLATGMACSILIFLWVQDELSFDEFNQNSERIFRVTTKISNEEAAVAPPSLAYAVKTQIPAIQNATRVISIQKMITVGTKKFNEKNIYYADSNFLQIFNYPLLRGNVATVLSSPNSVVLTETIAKKYFGSVDAAMGKTIYIDNDIKGSNLLVAGILKNIPSNSHLQPEMLIPMELYDKINGAEHGWTNFDVYVYFQLKDAVTPTSANLNNIQKEINDILKKNNKDVQASLFLQPLTDIHLHSHYMLDVPGQGSIQYVNIFALTALFIIIIACINFMNLATAVSGQRAKEVGLRKTVGALKPQLIAQFISESLLLSFISLLLSILIVYLMLPLFNQLANKSISFNPFNITMLFGLLSIAIITGLISGSYPAFFLSSFNPVKVLKGVKMLHGQKSFLRNGLIVLQFSISVILIISTLVIYNQLQYIQNRNIGFNKENLLYMKMPGVGDLKNNKDAMKATLAQYPDITNYTFTDELPTNLTSASQLIWRGMNPGTQVMAYRLRVDENFVKTFGMQMAAGHFFSKDFGGDNNGYVVNETALRTMGLNINNAIGKEISISLEDKEAPIIGVVKDFNFKPVQQPIEPLVMKTNFGGGYVVMRTTPANIQKVISKLQKTFHNVYGDYPFSYGFVNDDLSKLYITEQRMEKLFNVFSVLSIIISCLGLFGLATYATQRRIKEIGVRKVLGASESGIVVLLSKDFLKLVFIACIVAFPLSYWIMNKWLQSFAYRINISWWVFAVAGITALLIALITVSFQSIKAAIANPVKNLRTE
jgi:predicted permease